MTEQVVEIANRLYECRRTMRRLLGREKYRERVIGLMREIKSKSGPCSYLDTCQCAVTRAVEAGDGMAATWLCAATVELMDPDDWTPTLKD